MIALRRKLHKIPELGFEETKTLALILSHIKSYSKDALYPIQIHESEGGIWVDLEVNKDLPWILFRADMDGLPIEEKTGLPYASVHPGRMHACGHDCHSSMLLIAFKCICNGLVVPNSNIRFVWQRAEEITTRESGGKKLVKKGVCRGIMAAYGLHISSVDDFGIFYSRKGPLMCNSDHLSFTVEASGGHVMNPHIGSNAIDILADIHMSLRGFDRTILGPNEPIAFVPSISHAGDTPNIRPNTASFTYSLRNILSQERLEMFLNSIQEKIEAIVSAYPKAFLSSFTFTRGHPQLINTPSKVDKVEEALQKEGYLTAEFDLLFAGEDFAYYLQEVPGAFWSIGAGKSERHDHHTPHFNPSEDALEYGVNFWLTLAKA